MKKTRFLALCLCPYGYIVGMGLLFALSRNIPVLDDDTVIFLVMGIFLLLTGALCLCYLLCTRSLPVPLLARQNLRLKLWNTPPLALAIGILIYYVISTKRAAADGAQEGGLLVFLWILLLLPIFIHSFFLLWTSAITSIRISGCAEKRIHPALLLLHWVPIADFAASLCLYRRLTEKEPLS